MLAFCLVTHLLGCYAKLPECVCTQQGSDPSTYEMIQKIHTLQRRLIQKTEEVGMTIFKLIFISPLNRVASYTKSYIITPPTHPPTNHYSGSGEGTSDPGEGEAIHGNEASPAEAARTRGC